MFELNRAALETHQSAIERGIEVDSIEEIIEIVLEQEIVSYCNSNGCVSFDVNDLKFDEAYA